MLQSNADQAYSSIEEYFLAGAKPSDAHIYFSSLLTTLPSFFSLPNRPWCASDRTPYTTLTSFSANRDRRDLSQCIPLAQSNWLGCGVARKEENPPPCLLNDIKNICLSRLLSPSPGRIPLLKRTCIKRHLNGEWVRDSLQLLAIKAKEHCATYKAKVKALPRVST